MYGLKINHNGNKIKVIVENACEKPSPWGNGSDYEKHNRVKVINLKTRKRTTFDFWGSVMEPNQESFDGVISAITCYATDGLSFQSSRSFEDFCSEFGYDTDSRKAEKAYKGCEKADKALSRVLGRDYSGIMDLEGYDYKELKENGIAEILNLD